jgi:hypothetical protein
MGEGDYRRRVAAQSRGDEAAICIQIARAPQHQAMQSLPSRVVQCLHYAHNSMLGTTFAQLYFWMI